MIAIQYQRSMLAPVLADIASKGLKLDHDLVVSLYEESVASLNTLSQQLYTLTEGINLGSNKQLASFLYEKLGFECTERTEKGAPSTSIGTIRSLIPKTKEQKEFLSLYEEYNKVDQLLSKYLTLFYAVVKENDGLMFGEFNQGSTATHRLSSSGVPFKSDAFGKKNKQGKSCQFQNIPRQLKKCFVARNKGWLIGECDGAQLEFRVAAGVTGDEVAKQEICDLVDVHSVTASVIGCSRQDAKARTFAPLYGGNGANKKERDYCDFFRKKYNKISKTQAGWCHSVAADPDKKLVLPYGMVYNFPGTKMQADGYISGSTNIYNYPIQGLATAEIIPAALAYMWHNLPDGIEIVNTIHDSIVCEVRPDMVEVYQELCIRSMTTAVYEFLERVYGYKLDVPLGVGIKIGERWGAGDERTFQMEDGVVFEILKDENGKKYKRAVHST